MKVLKAKRVALAVGLWVAASIAASAKTPAYIDVELGGGAVLMPYNGNAKTHGVFSGGTFDVGAKYSLLFHPRKGWGASFGLNFSTFQGVKVLNDSLFSAAIDDRGRGYTLRADVSNWTERQQQYSFSIPISIFYQYQRPRHSGWFTSFGGQTLSAVLHRLQSYAGRHCYQRFLHELGRHRCVQRSERSLVRKSAATRLWQL